MGRLFTVRGVRAYPRAWRRRTRQWRRTCDGWPATTIPATVVYAGIDVTASAVFSGVRGAQLAGRASLIDCGALPARAGEREPFRELITALEQDLNLTAHRPGSR